jgi:hypothetical protein
VDVTVHRVGDLDIDEDLAFEHRSRLVERVGGWLMVATVAAASLGLLGSGPLSAASLRAEGFTLDFSRLARLQSSDVLTVRLDAAATRTPEVRVWVDRGYLDATRVESIHPAPIRTEGAPDRLIFVFAVADPGGPLTLQLRLQPQRPGVVHGRAGIERPGAAGAVSFRQFVFP